MIGIDVYALATHLNGTPATPDAVYTLGMAVRVTRDLPWSPVLSYAIDNLYQDMIRAEDISDEDKDDARALVAVYDMREPRMSA